jgi:ABC-2 type transport system ATP-binding protein
VRAPAAIRWNVLCGQLALAGALLAVDGLASRPHAVSLVLAAATGTATGVVLVVILAGRPRLHVPGTGRLPRLLVLGAFLALLSASEEVIWRGLVLDRLADWVGVPGAYAASTLGFALAHGERAALRTYLVVGAAFGGVYLVTGSLLAAIAAHTTYNLLVLLAAEGRRSLRPACAGLGSGDGFAPELAIGARGVEKRYRSVEALRGFDLEVRRGELVALLGPNGAGKTTAVQTMLGLRRPDSGIIRVLGEEPGALRARRRIGVTLQDMDAPELLRVGEVLSFVAAHFPRRRPLDELLAEFGLAGVQRRQVGGLSGGQRRRLALALAFAGDPELVFLDEPTTGLDVESRRAVWAAIRRFSASSGTILLTTHYLEEAEALASRVAVMREGRVIRDGPAADIKRELGAASLEDAFLLLTRGES